MKNGMTRGYLTFGSGKRVALSVSERAEFEEKIRYWGQCAVEKAASEENDCEHSMIKRNGVCMSCGERIAK